MAVSVKVIGIEELRAKFEKMGYDVPNKVITDAAVKGGEKLNLYIAENIRSNFKQRTGALLSSLKVNVTYAGNVRVGSYGIVYNRIHEFGGVINRKRASALTWLDDFGARHFATFVVIPSRPFVRPAYHEHKDDIIKEMGNEVMAYLGTV